MSSNTPRRSTRARRSTAKGKEYEDLIKSPCKSIKTNEDSDEWPSDEEQNELLQTDRVLLNTPLAGKEIYSFNKVKKHQRIVSTPIIEEESLEKGQQLKQSAKTPYILRHNLKKGIKSLLKHEDSSDEELKVFEDSGSEFSMSSSDSESGESEGSKSSATHSESASEDTKNHKINRQTSVKKANFSKQKQNQHSKKATNSKYIIKTEEYFSHAAHTKIKTSNHTLDKLKTPRLSQNELTKLLANMKLAKNHRKTVESFCETAEEQFHKWICLLNEDFNILVYGLGSKRNILNAFHEEIANNGFPVIVINGFFPSLTLKDILDSIIENLLELGENPSNAYEACELIKKHFEGMPEQHLYLIVHNIEGETLRNNKCQMVLAKLAAVGNIHLVASIDHINAPLIWDHNKLSKFKFIWYDVTSYLPYITETSFESSMMVQRTGNLALSSLKNVFLSLTANSKGIFMIILKYQLEHANNQYYQGLLFKDLYWSCREAFLVSSDLALRAQLTEFTDHKMVKLKRSTDGAEYVIIPIASNLLQQFLNEQV